MPTVDALVNTYIAMWNVAAQASPARPLHPGRPTVFGIRIVVRSTGPKRSSREA